MDDYKKIIYNTDNVSEIYGVKKMKKVMLVNPPSSTDVYKHGKLKGILPKVPLISLASLAGALEDRGHEVYIADLAHIADDPIEDFKKWIGDFNPTHIGITFSTPLAPESKMLAEIAKGINKDIFTMAGGVHPSALPKEVLDYGCFDSVLIGEGERAILDMVGKNKKGIVGPYPRIEDLDELPKPAWHLFDLKRYTSPRITARDYPVGALETSRGCFGRCGYCYGSTMHGHYIRTKSTNRVIEDINDMLDAGFKELHVYDDSFTAKIDRACEVTKGFVDAEIDVPMRMDCGLRVDTVHNRPDFFKLLNDSSVYGVSFGYESGNQKILNRMRKGIKLEQSVAATKLAKDYGMETIGFFILGYLDETKETINDTIEFAKKLDPLYAKFTIATPFPGTEMFDELKALGLINTFNWADYNFHGRKSVYTHPNPDLTNEYLWEQYDRAHREFYFRGAKIMERILFDLSRGPLFTFDDVKTAVNTFL
jgi:anaerobic magnesium-protoporphyrin IX monomethyl ester cyclase